MKGAEMIWLKYGAKMLREQTLNTKKTNEGSENKNRRNGGSEHVIAAICCVTLVCA